MDKPWLNEPDQVEWTDEATGLECMIRRTRSAGHLCGYVRIPEGHPLHRVSYNDPVPPAIRAAVEDAMNGPVGKRGILSVFCFDADNPRVDILFDVHGGITFSDEWETGTWWYGFDCAHSGDLCPTTVARYPEFADPGAVYRNIEYVTAECTSLARQIAALKREAA